MNRANARSPFTAARRRICNSADEPDRLRGVQHGKAWCDEVSTWRRGTDAWRNLLLGLRLGKRPQVVATCTPRPNVLTIELLKGALM